MAEKKNKHLVRLNDLYHFLNDQGATVKIKYTHKGEEFTKEFTADGDGESIKEMFSQGCGVHGRALNNITGNRSFVAKKEVGRYNTVLEKHKDVIKSINYRFKEDSNEKSPLRHYSESKTDLFLKKNFSHHSFLNISKVYPSAPEEIKNEILYVLKNGYVDQKKDSDDYIRIQSTFDSSRDFFEINHAENFNESIREDLVEILSYWEGHYSSNEDPIGLDKDVLNILPGIGQDNMPFNRDRAKKDHIPKLNEEEIIDRLSDKRSWVSVDRYHLMYALEQKFAGRKLKKLPKYVHALLLLMEAEFSAVKYWIYSTVKEEIKNIEFSIRLSSEDGKTDGVYLPGLSIEELSTVLEDYNFNVHPNQIFKVDNNTITNSPLFRYGVQEGGFSYHKTEFQYALVSNLLEYLYTQLKQHIGYYDSYEDFESLKEIYRDIILINDPEIKLF